MAAVAQKMSPKKILWILFIFLSIIIITSLFSPFAYGACRNRLLHTKGYGVWVYQQTDIDLIFIKELSFDDGINTLWCWTIGIGPLWVAPVSDQTILGTFRELDYYGVRP